MTTPTTPEPEKGATMRFGDLKRMIADSVNSALSGLTGDQGQPPQRQPLRGGQQPQRGGGSRNVDDEVRTAVEKLEADRKRREEREARDKGVEDKLTALEERTKEKAPVERRRVHKVMGWGE
jgi:hypothetical protein